MAALLFGYCILVILLLFLVLLKRVLIKLWVASFLGITTGLFCGYILSDPLLKWDENQRLISGNLISNQLEDFKLLNGAYP
ncbi:MAG: hypothetical protein AAF693_02740, partial [Bacteroidota bacterium]